MESVIFILCIQHSLPLCVILVLSSVSLAASLLLLVKVNGLPQSLRGRSLPRMLRWLAVTDLFFHAACTAVCCCLLAGRSADAAALSRCVFLGLDLRILLELALVVSLLLEVLQRGNRLRALLPLLGFFGTLACLCLQGLAPADAGMQPQCRISGLMICCAQLLTAFCLGILVCREPRSNAEAEGISRGAAFAVTNILLELPMATGAVLLALSKDWPAPLQATSWCLLAAAGLTHACAFLWRPVAHGPPRQTRHWAGVDTTHVLGDSSSTWGVTGQLWCSTCSEPSTASAFVAPTRAVLEEV